jgi:hypothetical protein
MLGIRRASAVAAEHHFVPFPHCIEKDIDRSGNFRRALFKDTEFYFTACLQGLGNELVSVNESDGKV